MEPALELWDEELLEDDSVDDATPDIVELEPDLVLELEEEFDEPTTWLSWLMLEPELELELEVAVEELEDESEAEVELLFAEIVLPLPPGDLPLMLMLLPVLSS